MLAQFKFETPPLLLSAGEDGAKLILRYQGGRSDMCTSSSLEPFFMHAGDPHPYLATTTAAFARVSGLLPPS